VAAPSPFYDDGRVTLYHGNALELLPNLGRVDAIVTDPPYAITHLEWDQWPAGWPALASRITDQLWCFGSLRMFLERAAELADWRLAQDVVWEKHNGSNSAADRFRRVHEIAAHFVRGPWSDLYRSPQFTPDATPRQVRRKKRPTQWGNIGSSSYTSTDGGPRHMRSVIRAKSCHGYATNETQKPEAIVTPLVAFSVPPGGIVCDPFAGSGTTLVVARQTGRRAIGIELRRAQCDDIVCRLKQLDLALSAPGERQVPVPRRA
jgi:site-specific DNA-methyltransferase (adenine-specific)